MPDPVIDAGPPVRVRQGVVEAWDPATGNNTVRVAGGKLVNITASKAGAAAMKVGDVVLLLSAGNRWYLLGTATTPGDPGTVPSWTPDLEALTPLTDLAAVTDGTTITGGTQQSSGTGPRVAINDPAYPGEIVLYTGDPNELEPARLKPFISGTTALLRLLGPKATGMTGVPSSFDLEANTSTAERQATVDVGRFNLHSSFTTIDGFSSLKLGDGTDYITITGQAVTDADLSSATNILPGDKLWTSLALVNSWVKDTVNPPAALSDPAPAYFKDVGGVVHVRGYIKSGTAITIATLPAGYRPSMTFESPLLRANTGSANFATVRVQTNGVMDVLTNFASAAVRLSLWFSFPTL